MDGDRNPQSIPERLARAEEVLEHQDCLHRLATSENIATAASCSLVGKSRKGRPALSEIAKLHDVPLADLQNDLELLQIVRKVAKVWPRVARDVMRGRIQCSEHEIRRWGTMPVSKLRLHLSWLDLTAAPS